MASKASSFLAKKAGPVPVWLLLVGLAGAGYWLYRRYQSGASSAITATDSSTVASPAASLGLAPSTGTSTDTGTTSTGSADTSSATPDLVSALGGQQASLLSELEQVNQDVVGLATSQLNYAQTQTTLGSFNTQTQPAAGSQPGGSNAPVVYYMAPNAVAPQPGAGPAAAAPVKAATSTPTRYYTYKRDVPLAGGQTVHFVSGRGYFAA